MSSCARRIRGVARLSLADLAIGRLVFGIGHVRLRRKSSTGGNSHARPAACWLLSCGMFLVQILLPLKRNGGERQPPFLFEDVRFELVTRFGGLTAYTRSPATGLWRESGQARTSRDDVVIFEVMTEELDRPWWGAFRRLLEDRFQQDAIVVRALPLVSL